MKIKKTVKAEELYEFLKDTANFIATLDYLDGMIKVEITPIKGTRSQKQNAYYWLILEIIGDEMGEPKEIVHEIMREKFLRDMSELGPYNRSTTDLDTAEMVTYTDNVRAFAESFLNIITPDPE